MITRPGRWFGCHDIKDVSCLHFEERHNFLEQIIGPSLGDGLYSVKEITGVPAVVTEPMTPDAQASYLYFKLDNGFYFNQPQPVSLTVTYWDEGYGLVGLNYDTAPCGSSFGPESMYRQIGLFKRHNTLTWKTTTVRISNATFAGNQNWGADLRLVTGLSPLTISEVKIEKLP